MPPERVFVLADTFCQQCFRACVQASTRCVGAFHFLFQPLYNCIKHKIVSFDFSSVQYAALLLLMLAIQQKYTKPIK